MNLQTAVVLRGEETGGHAAGFERLRARTAAEAAGVDPPEWALQPIPEITVVGPPIPDSNRDTPWILRSNVGPTAKDQGTDLSGLGGAQPRGLGRTLRRARP